MEMMGLFQIVLFLGVAFNTEDDPYDSHRFRSIDSQEFKEQGGGLR